jgi:hypothetical protein
MSDIKTFITDPENPLWILWSEEEVLVFNKTSKTGENRIIKSAGPYVIDKDDEAAYWANRYREVSSELIEVFNRLKRYEDVELKSYVVRPQALSEDEFIVSL